MFSPGVDHDELVKLAERHFSSFPSSPDSLPSLSACRYTGSDMRVRNDDMPFAHIALAVEVGGWGGGRDREERGEREGGGKGAEREWGGWREGGK